MIDNAYQRLLDGYLRSNHRKKVDIIDKAYRFARLAHEGIRRRSGEPYIMHPIAVATIVSQEIGLGSTSICAALLHDVVEDTDYTIEDIEAQFGKKIAQIVDGLTKISGGIFGDLASVQAENFRKLLLTMSDDIRVVLIKMADRLHNMRTLQSMPPQKQYKIAGETLYIYAPLAHRLGLFAIKTELEDLSFKHEHPDAYARIEQQLALSEAKRNELFARFSAPIRERLDRMGLNYEFRARIKSCYSIWKKMETKHIPFEEVYDLYAARIVFECDHEADEKRICWNIYSEITDLYRLHPDRVRDWISTPKGETITLPKDASVLDMAFMLHTELGTHCIAGKVNHKLVPMSHRLASGDQVEVLTSHSQQPKPEWDKFLVTAKGKTRLRSALKHSRRVIIDRGERRLQTLLAEHNVEPTSEVMSRIISAEHAQNKEDLYYMIGNDEIALSDQLLKGIRPQQGNMFTRLLRNPFGGKTRKPDSKPQSTRDNDDTAPGTPGKVDTKQVYVLQSQDGVSNYTVASCCHPIPGDDVVGYVNERGEVIVHKLDCPTAMRLKSVDGGRLVQTRWDTSSARFPATIHVEGIDRLGILQEIIYIISTNMAINMRALNIRADQGVFKCDLNVLIADVNVVTNLCKRLKRVKGVNMATRVNS